MNQIRRFQTSLWKVIRNDREFTPQQLQRQTGAHRKTVATYLDQLVRHGYVEQIKAAQAMPHPTPARYRLVRDTGLYAPRVERGAIVDPNLDPTAVDRVALLWQAMRTLKSFDVPQLAGLSQLHTGTINRYLKSLREAGYVAVVQSANGQVAAYNQYLLVRNTGPYVPTIHRDGTVFDPNLN